MRKGFVPGTKRRAGADDRAQPLSRGGVVQLRDVLVQEKKDGMAGCGL